MTITKEWIEDISLPGTFEKKGTFLVYSLDRKVPVDTKTKVLKLCKELDIRLRSTYLDKHKID